MQTSKYTLHQTMIVDDPYVLLVEVSLYLTSLLLKFPLEVKGWEKD